MAIGRFLRKGAGGCARGAITWPSLTQGPAQFSEDLCSPRERPRGPIQAAAATVRTQKTGTGVALFVQFQADPQGFTLEFEDDLNHIAAAHRTSLVVSADDNGGD